MGIASKYQPDGPGMSTVVTGGQLPEQNRREGAHTGDAPGRRQPHTGSDPKGNQNGERVGGRGSIYLPPGTP